MTRIGLTQRVEFSRERRDCLDQAWYRLLARYGLWPVPLPNFQELPVSADRLVEELGLAGVILTGGNDLEEIEGATNVATERDRFEALLIDACERQEVPVLGVCRGLQKLVVHHGGRLTAVAEHAGTVHALVVSENGELPLASRDEVNSYHDFGVDPDGVGDSLRVVATAPDGTVEAVAHRRLPQWGVMWHPERRDDPRDDDIFRSLFC